MSALASLIDALARLNRALAALFRTLAWALLALMTLIVVLQVLFRYGLNSSLTWSEDVALMMMVWVAFAVAPIAYRQGSNVALDSLIKLIPGRAGFLLYLLMHILLAVTLLVLLSEALALIGRSRIRANTVDVDMKYIYMIMPAAFVAMMAVALELAGRCIVGLTDPAAPRARMPSDTPDPGAGDEPVQRA